MTSYSTWIRTTARWPWVSPTRNLTSVPTTATHRANSLPPRWTHRAPSDSSAKIWKIFRACVEKLSLWVHVYIHQYWYWNERGFVLLYMYLYLETLHGGLKIRGWGVGGRHTLYISLISQGAMHICSTSVFFHCAALNSCFSLHVYTWHIHGRYLCLVSFLDIQQYLCFVCMWNEAKQVVTFI